MPGAAFGAMNALPSPNERGIVDVFANLGYDQGTAAGTGMVLTPSGEVLTNNHVIRGAISVRVVVPGTGHAYAARVVGYGIGQDLAVIQVIGAPTLKTVTPGDSASVTIGAPVTAVGDAGGVGGAPSVSTGTIVALHQSVTLSDDQGGSEQLSHLIETDTPLRPGDSGGALLDATGDVLGIITGANVFEAEASAGASGTDVKGFIIPIDRALEMARQIERGHSSLQVHVGATPFIGLEVEPAAGNDYSSWPPGAGAIVVAAYPSSPAANAGMQPGDLLTSFGGRRILSISTITDVLMKLSPGATVAVDWTEPGGELKAARIRLAAGPPQ
jgi:S1-C subfamily serine protease